MSYKAVIGNAVESDVGLSLGYAYGQQQINVERSGELDNNQALEKFLSDIETRAFRIAQIATNDSDDALDIVQDAMFKLVEKYSAKREDEWGALFHRILQSRIRDWYRRTKVRNKVKGWLSLLANKSPEESEEDPLQRVEDPQGRSPEQLLETSDGIESLEGALQALPLRQQQAFLLRAWEGLSVKQTAQAMACAEGSVKTHYSRALQALRKKLGEHSYDE